MKLMEATHQLRVLLVSEDQEHRMRLREQLGARHVILESRSFEEGLVTLEGQSTGITLLAAAAAELQRVCRHLERIREVFPEELVVVLVPGLDLDTMRRLSRAGAFDALDPAWDDDLTLMEVLESASEHQLGSAYRRQVEQSRVMEAAIRHEREAAGMMVDAHGASGAWAGLEVEVRTRWLAGYVKNATLHDVASRAAFVRELAAELVQQQEPAELLVALHVQAMSSAHGQAELGMQRARSLLVDLFVETLRQRPVSHAASEEATVANAASSASWHRWRLGGEESWWLVVDGWIRAHVRVGSSSVEGAWIDPSTKPGARTARVHSGLLPRLPEALREVERRVQSGYVLDVVTADANS